MWTCQAKNACEIFKHFRVPSYARKDVDLEEYRDDRYPKEKFKDNGKNGRKYESVREAKREPELRFSKKAREREKELKKERERDNGKSRSYNERDKSGKGEEKRAEDKFRDSEKRDGARSREETAGEKKERIRKERIRNKVRLM